MKSDLVIGESLPGSDYIVCDREGQPRDDRIARPIADGGAGIVYRVEYKGMPRALKLLAPRDFRNSGEMSTVDSDHWQKYLETFKHEIRLLTTITHTNIAKILDHGEVQLPGLDFSTPYYVMDLVGGPELLPGITTDYGDYKSILALLDDVAAALGFLHRRGILHADVKSENIRIDATGSRPRAILLDLGVAKILSDPSDPRFPGLNPESSTYFFSTRAITRPERQQFLKRPVPVQFLQSFLPDHDLFAFGLLLRSLLSDRAIASRLRFQLRDPGFEAMELICGRLSGPQQDQFLSTDSVRDGFLKIDPDYMSPMGIPELSVAISPRTGVPLPEARVRLGERLLAVVDAAPMQRLRRLKQLSFVYLGWPGARHSRLAYSLGRYHLAREYLSNLLENARFRLTVGRGDVEAALIYSLVRDVGHYPLAHIFEEVRGAERDPGIKTDTEVARCILSPGSEIDRAHPEGLLSERLERACNRNSRDGASLPEVLAVNFSSSSLERLSKLVLGDCGDQIGRLLLGLFDSPVDVGKVTYLRLDSMMTGVEFGRGIDIDGLLANLTVPRARELEPAQPVIGILQRGLAAAESAILARYWMIQRVYWSPTNRALMTQVKFLIRALRRAQSFSFADFVEQNFVGSHEQALGYLSDLLARERSKVEAAFGRRTINPAEGITAGSRAIFRRLVTLNRQYPEDSDLYDRLAFGAPSQVDELEKKLEQELDQLTGGSGSAGAGSVLIDVPAVKNEETGGKLWVYWPAHLDEPKDVFEASPMLQRFRDEFTVHAKKARIFVSPSLAEKLEESDAIGVARTRLKNVLREMLAAR